MKRVFVDTHAHLTFDELLAEKELILKRAAKAGVKRIVVIGSGNDISSARDAAQFVEKTENLKASVGIHPHDADTWNGTVKEKIKKLAALDEVRAIGETGLDYYRKYSPVSRQQEVFKQHIQIAKDLGKPLIIHCREAHKDTLRILQEEGAARVGGVIHCFSGDVELANQYMELGFYIGVGGVVTYKNAKKLPRVVAALPVEAMVLETDCPYLSPEPFRGKMNEPAYIPLIAAKIAEIKKLSIEDVRRVTSLNAEAIFGLGLKE